MKRLTKQDYIKILMEDKFNNEDVNTKDVDFELLNSMSLEQLKMMMTEDEEYVEEID